MIKRHQKTSPVFAPSIRAKRSAASLLVLVATIGIAGTTFFYEKYRTVQAESLGKTQQDTATIVEAVGTLIELPENEIPTTAIISNQEELRHQPFFASVKNGDVLLAYATAMKAILYRPGTHKIINMAPLAPQPQ